MSNLTDPEDLDDVEQGYLIAIRRAAQAGDNDLAHYYQRGLEEYRNSYQARGLE